jgi:hypothetical protein
MWRVPSLTAARSVWLSLLKSPAMGRLKGVQPEPMGSAAVKLLLPRPFQMVSVPVAAEKMSASPSALKSPPSETPGCQRALTIFCASAASCRYRSGYAETCTRWHTSPIGAVCHELFGYSRTIALRKALVAQIGLSRFVTLPHDARCWNRPRLSWSTSSLMFSMAVSTITVVTAMTAALGTMPRSRTALTTMRAHETRYAVM